MPKYGLRVFFRRSGGPREILEIGPSELGDLNIDGDTLIQDVMRSGAIEVQIRRRLRARMRLAHIEEIKALLVRYDRDHAALNDEGAAGVSRCRSILRLANFVLPHSAREDALDEWMDEIQSAAEEGLPFRRRALSILCRSLPALALRARLPVRARRGEG